MGTWLCLPTLPSLRSRWKTFSERQCCDRRLRARHEDEHEDCGGYQGRVVSNEHKGIAKPGVRAEYSTGPVIRTRDVLYVFNSVKHISGSYHGAGAVLCTHLVCNTLVLIRGNASLVPSAVIMLVSMARSKASITPLPLRTYLPPTSKGRQRRRADPCPHSPPPPSRAAAPRRETAGGSGGAAYSPRAMKVAPRACHRAGTGERSEQEWTALAASGGASGGGDGAAAAVSAPQARKAAPSACLQAGDEPA